MAALVGDTSAHRIDYYPGQDNYQSLHEPQTVEAYYEGQSYNRVTPRVQPYAVAGYYTGNDVITLPTLPETPSESDDLFPPFPQGALYEAERYYTTDGVLSAPLEGKQVFKYYSPENGDQALVYYSAGEEEDIKRNSPGETSYRCYHQPGIKMGSGSSVIPEPKPAHKTKKHRRGSNSSSDNGGFEPATPKPALGVKEKLRSSFDKISLKTPFRWNSSDKLSHHGVTPKGKNKNNRRYSDSSAAFFTVNPTEDKKKPSRSNEAEKRSPWATAGVSRMVRAYTARSGSASDEVDGRVASDNNDYVNLVSIQAKFPKSQSHPNKRLDAAPDNVFENNSARIMNDYYVMHNTTMPRHQTIENKDAVSRAKGTWKMLKAAKTKQIPIKAPQSSYASLVSGSSDTLRSSETLQDPSDPRTPSPFNVDEPPHDEPPKLAPVSGKLILDKSSVGTIVRPTAFKLTAPSGSNASRSPQDTWEHLNGQERDNEVYRGLDRSRSSIGSAETNNSDSGRHSVTSIPAGGVVGGAFSCSGSEGYESARVSSSTTHSAIQEHDPVCVEAAPSHNTLSDDVMIHDLESRVKEKQGEIHLLRRSLEDNEKTLHKVYEDQHRTRESEMMELKQKYSQQLKSQTHKSLQTQHRLERQYHRMQDEQNRLLRANKELEERIRSMTDAIDAQSRQYDDIAELKARLEEGEMEMQQKHGEISLLKRQLKEKQLEITQRTGDTISLRSQNRELFAQLAQRDKEAIVMNARLNDRNLEIAELERQLSVASSRGSWSTAGSLTSPLRHYLEPPVYSELEKRSRDPSVCSDQSRDDKNYLSPPSPPQHSESPANFSPGERDELLKRLHAAESRCAAQEKNFDRERRQWADDKCKVIKYQKQLQANYVQMYKRSHALEREVKVLSTRLQSFGVSAVVGTSGEEGLPDGKQHMCYPMEI
ncbi:uncharacterized protein LOC143459518 isoform X2 [Clavelina lepadiformis]